MGIISSSINAIANAASAKKQYEYDKELAAIQNQYNIDMWNMQNEYNTPTAQMQRLVDAGLSPNLAYGSVSTGNASSAPEMTAAGRKAPNLGVFNFSDPIMPFIGKLEAVQQLRSKILDNIEKAGQIAGKGLAFTFNSPADQNFVTTEANKSLKQKIYEFTHPYDSSLQGYYSQLHNALIHTPEFKNQLMGAQTRGKSAATIYQNMVNDWFKTDKIFNYVNQGLRTVGGFVPKLNIRKGGFDNHTYHEYVH